MRRFNARPNLRDEQGAILPLVALSIVAIMGMVALAVDVGSLMTTRRSMVNAADAAALAAAQSCARTEGRTLADASALLLAQSNMQGATLVAGYPRYNPSCNSPAGIVTVRLNVDASLYFAPAVGFRSSTPVVTEAVATWGGAGISEHVAPLMLSAYRLRTCDIPPPQGFVIPPEGIECWFWWDNSAAAVTDGALAEAEWGTLDLLKWNVDPSVHCDNSTPPQFQEWMFSGYSGDLSINEPLNEGDPRPPTYVCRGQGNFGASLDNKIRTAIERELELYFPVNNPDGQIDMNGELCPPQSGNSCSPDKYDIMGFARLVITHLYKGNTQEAQDNCISRIAGASPSPNARCMRAVWIDYRTEGFNSGGGENFGLVPVQLVG